MRRAKVSASHRRSLISSPKRRRGAFRCRAFQPHCVCPANFISRRSRSTSRRLRPRQIGSKLNTLSLSLSAAGQHHAAVVYPCFSLSRYGFPRPLHQHAPAPLFIFYVHFSPLPLDIFGPRPLILLLFLGNVSLCYVSLTECLYFYRHRPYH